RQEEDQRRVAAELADGRANDLAVLQQGADVPPLEVEWLPFVLAAAARLDVIELGAVDRRALVGVPVKRPPHETEGDPQRADNEEQAPPAELLRDPEERHAQEAEAE